MVLDHRVVHLAAYQDLGQRVADQLARAQLALRRSFSGVR